MSPVTTFIFDLSDVLIGGMGDLVTPLSRALGLSEDRCYELVNGQWLVELCCGEIDEDEYLRRILSCAAPESPGIGYDEMKRLIRAGFHRQVPGMEDMVRLLARRYQVVLLSDHAREWIAYIHDVHPFLSVIPQHFYSFEAGHSKRQGTAFENLLKIVRRPPKCCLLVDDNPSNIERAKCHGIRGIVFQDVEQLLLQLPEYGVRLTPAEVLAIRGINPTSPSSSGVRGRILR